jgi:biotin carboxyl carrier protein
MYRVALSGSEYLVRIVSRAENHAWIEIDSRQLHAVFCFAEEGLHLEIGGHSWTFSDRLPQSTAHAPGQVHDGQVRAPMNGIIVEVSVQPGDLISPGQRLLTLESMKIEHPLLAPCAGKALQVHAAAGNQVSPGKVLVVIEPAL